MKWFLILLVLGGAGYAFYVFQDEIFDLVDGDKDKPGEEQPSGGGEPEQPGTSSEGGAPAKPSQRDEGNKPSKPPKPENDPIAQRYPLPDFKPIEELVGNWNEVPPSAFPREVTLKKDAKYIIAGGAGSSKAKAGSKATALSLTAGQLVIAPRKESPIRGRIPIDDTSFKAELAKAYDLYKQRKRKEVLEQRKRARALPATEPTPPPASSGGGRTVIQRGSKPPQKLLAEYEAKIGKMPERGNDGRVTLMVQSIRKGDVSEIKLDEIRRWGPVRYELVEGQPYWTGTVSYKTSSLFGTFDTEAMALMRNSEVVTWVYTGSLEEVP